ncbi:SEL1-like repeat protein [Ancylobacter dichloromethanicus]|uniref:SEL1-like repeat protein n=1 Tax=Ancylobacter dichloromethanicus TaxID=518825 RepID=UPI001BCAF328|nr:SEL1-like repeat protein [Ancylobacter dichloromethanicus]MBS7555065.1 SEL1-like repeat protein [Ancylobacter dichloromethanicus]
MRQEAPSTTGQIAPEAWRAMSDAARQAGLPLDQWLRDQLLGTTAAGTPPAGAESLNNLAELRRRIEELAGQLGRISPAGAPAYPASPHPAFSLPADAGWVEAPAPIATARPAPSLSPAAPTGSTYADERLAAAIREIDHRLEALQLTRPRGTAPVSAPTPAAIEAAVAEIAARQSELDRDIGARRPPTGPYADRPPAVRETSFRETPGPRLGRDPSGDAPAGSRLEIPGDTPPAPPLAASVDAASAGTEARPPLHETIAALQGELAAMRHALATLAPRRAVDELQRVVQQLADRVARSDASDEELRGTLAALREMIGGLALPERPALLLGRIEAVERKLDIVNAKVVDGATVARLQAQVGEIRELLARALSSDAVRALAEQVSLLATRVSEMAADEDRAVRSAVGSLERRLDTLVDRIGSQPAPVIPLDDLVSRLDAIQANLASARREVPAGMETLIRGLSERIERIEQPVARADDGPRLDMLGRQIENLTRTVDKAVGGADVSRQLAGIERAVNDLFIQMEETRATFLAAPRPRPPAGSGGAPEGGTAHLRRESAGIDDGHGAEGRRGTQDAADTVELSQPAEAADAGEFPALAAEVRETAPAAGPAAAPAPGAVAFTPAPASIPKAFEPQLMRAALEALSRSSAAGRAPLAESKAAATPLAPPAPPVDEPVAAPTPADDSAPTRAAFIAQARRAAQPAGRTADVAPPPLRSYIAARPAAKPGRWLARVRAMLLIGLCGSALAYGSWHVLAQLRQQQLRAAAPASVPMPDDITGSVGTDAPRAPRPNDLPGKTPAPIGPSSLALPGDLPGDLPGGIASPALRGAALGGDLGAAFEIARRFMEGEGVAPSPAHAAQWYAFASAQGSAPATYRLGMLYEKGADGVPRDVARALALYEQAAGAGNVAAMHNLGVLLASGDAGAPDYGAAAQWFTRAAERGVRDSQYNLAVLYARGLGVPTSAADAWRWFALAAARGDSQAAAKRDILTPALDPRTLDAARRQVEQWTPLVADAEANDVSTIGSGATPQKTASR